MTGPVDLHYPFAGRWIARNSPADRIPSHGSTLYATTYAIDFVPLDKSGRASRYTVGAFLRPERPDRFVGYGRRLLAPVAGEVVAVRSTEPDHAAYRGLASLAYALGQARRATAGWVGLAGNHVMIRSGDVVVALCHMQLGSVKVQVGQRVEVGDTIGRCGNSGNSYQPHVHVQAMSGTDVTRASGLPITFLGDLPRGNETVDATPP